MFRSILTAATISLLTIAAAPAFASPSDPVSITVRYNDLDLNNPAGQAELNRRIESAARRVCATNDRSVAANTARRQCIATALSNVAR